MVSTGSILNLLIELIKNMSVLIVLAYILTRTKIYAEIIQSKEAASLKQKVCLTLICGIFAIYGTLSGIKIGGAIANVRDLGPAIAGLIGGPFAGLAAGLIGGIHRYFVGGFTYLSSSASTVVAGLAGGMIYRYRKGKFISVAGGAAFMALMEIFHMGLLLAIERPFDQAMLLVENIGLPMIFTDALGMSIFAFIVRNFLNEKETQRTKELIESELSIARDIQMSIVPKIFPASPELPESILPSTVKTKTSFFFACRTSITGLLIICCQEI
ncbi:MAG TPA: LytS/YhcK type 5TM receptor domain-containing protein [Clostridia bacterium]|nr:LytS/YhcK type 5TM receptor domain-containing protein [Clostridia bacterium]